MSWHRRVRILYSTGAGGRGSNVHVIDVDSGSEIPGPIAIELLPNEQEVPFPARIITFPAGVEMVELVEEQLDGQSLPKRPTSVRL